MSTIVSRAHRLHSLAWLAAAVIVSLALTDRPTHASRCPGLEPTAPTAAPSEQAPAPAPAATPTAAKAADQPAAAADLRLPTDGSTGLDLEVRIWNVRIEFPWLKSLPVTPGRHIVLSLFETTDTTGANR
jgi:hypothetical protein